MTERWHRGLQVGDVLFYPEFGPGHFGVVLHWDPRFLLVVEGYWKGQPTAIHVLSPRTDHDGSMRGRGAAGLGVVLRAVLHG
jgi:hypothetical protein